MALRDCAVCQVWSTCVLMLSSACSVPGDRCLGHLAGLLGRGALLDRGIRQRVGLLEDLLGLPVLLGREFVGALRRLEQLRLQGGAVSEPARRPASGAPVPCARPSPKPARAATARTTPPMCRRVVIAFPMVLESRKGNWIGQIRPFRAAPAPFFVPGGHRSSQRAVRPPQRRAATPAAVPAWALDPPREPAMSTTRRHDIDALRALAFGLLILYHLGMYYVADWPWHLKSPHAAEWLRWPMLFVNIWRMDLVFLVSGIAFGFLSRTASPWRAARPARLAAAAAAGLRHGGGGVLPGLCGGVDNGPHCTRASAPSCVRYLAGGPWPQGAFDGSDFGITWNHLWYLPYLFFYTAVLACCCRCCAGRPAQRLRAAFTGLRGGGCCCCRRCRWCCTACCWRRAFRPRTTCCTTATCMRCTSPCSCTATGWARMRACGHELTRLRHRAWRWPCLLAAALSSPARAAAGPAAGCCAPARPLPVEPPWWPSWAGAPAPEPALALAGLGQRVGLSLVHAAPDPDRAGAVALAPLRLGPVAGAARCWSASRVLGCWLLTDGLIRRAALAAAAVRAEAKRAPARAQAAGSSARLPGLRRMKAQTPRRADTGAGSASIAADSAASTMRPFSITTARSVCASTLRQSRSTISVAMPVARISRDHAPDLGHDQRRQAFGGFVEDQQRAGSSSARGRSTASAARRPTAAGRRATRRSARRGKVASTRSKRPVALAVGPGARAHHQVLAHRQVREDAAAFGHVADAARAPSSRAPSR